jgi:putative SOS response-associated peptidase YedK
MCYYNGRKVSYAEFIRLKNLEKQITSLRESKPVHKGFDYEDWPIIKPIGKYDFEQVEMEWGFIPDTWRGKKIDTREKVKRFRNGYPDLFGKMDKGILMLNAMGEELLLPEKKYREAALNGRVLVLSWGFYESKHIPEMGKRGNILKSPYTIPHYIGLKGVENVFPMAGVFKEWKDAETGEVKETFAIATTAAPDGHIMAEIHNSKKRTPTIFTWEQAERWLYDDLTEPEITQLATSVFPSELMTAHKVDKNFVTSQNPMQPCEYDEDFISTGIKKGLF